MNPELQEAVFAALERPHRLGMIGGKLEDQLAHCASWSRVLAGVAADEGVNMAESRGFDLGTGGGVPGVALAAGFPQCMWTLVEIRTARATEVERSLLQLGLVAVVRTEPAQALGREADVRETGSIVTARAFGPPAMTAECASGLLRPGGFLMVSEPPDDDPERWPTAGLERLGLGPVEIYDDDGHRFAVMTKDAPLDDALPRQNANALRRGWRF